MKKIVFSFLLFSCYTLTAQFPNSTILNTATNATGTGTLTTGSNDLNWMAAFSSSLGPYVPAVVCGLPQVPNSWAISPYSNCNWICYPFGCGILAVQNCSQTPPGIDVYYKLTFNLPANACGQSVTTPSAYCLSLDFYSDNCVYAIYVNNVLSYQTSVSNPYNYSGYMSINGTSVSLCNNWQVGSNTIIVHTMSNYDPTPNSSYEGFLAQVNQTLNISTPCGSIQPQPCSSSLTVNSGSVIVNHYSPLSANLSAGSSTLQLAAPSLMNLVQGDLIMVYQAQGASISTANTANYGDITNYNSAGLYEFKYVQSVSGNVITTQGTFTNSYAISGRAQAVKVPQYTTLTVNSGSSVVAKKWKDTTISSVQYRFGGLVAIHANSIVNNGTITANGTGFRGGVALNTGYILNIPDYVSSNSVLGGEKGEGIAGYQTDYDLMGGRYCRGASANGGGGGNSTNASGGGGANGNNGNVWSGQGVMIVNSTNPIAGWVLDPGYIANSNALTNSSGGGRGGYAWAWSNGNAYTDAPGNSIWTGDYRREVGGLGGRPLTNINAENRVYFGGGGGAPQMNDNGGTSGTDGGGIIYLITTNLTGSGQILSNGISAGNNVGCHCDGSPGAGAGGSIIIKAGTFSTLLTIAAEGGQGGSQITPISTYYESEGPGGGGGGGFVALSSGAIVPSINGGNNGTSLSPAVTEMPSNGATSGATGQTATVSTAFITYTAPPLSVSSNTPCSGASLTFSCPAASSYTWAGPNSFTSSIQNPTITNSSTLMSGTYSVTLGSSGNCQSSFTTLTLNVTVTPTPTILISSTSILCNGESSTLTATGANSYTWFPSNQTTSIITVVPFSNTVYTVIGTSIGDCTVIATVTVNTPPPIQTTLTASSSSICLGSPPIILTINSSGGTGTSSYTWNTSANSNTFVANEVSGGNYIYTVQTQDQNLCTVTQSISVDFIPNPTLTIPNTTVCYGSAVTITATGANSYTWSTGSISNNPVVSPTVNTVYTATGSALGCTAVASGSVQVLPIPTLTTTPAAITCTGLGSATVEAGGTTGPYSYTWMPTAQTTSNAIGMYPGVFTITVMDYGTGCLSVTSVTFTPLVPLTGTVSATNSLTCNGSATGTANIVLSNGSGSQNYSWSNSLGTQTTTSANALGAGVHTVTVIDNLTYCTVTQIFLITQPPALTLNLTASSPTACTGQIITLTANTNGGTPNYSYSWTPGILSNTQTISFATNGPRTYSMTSKDFYNCSITKTISVNFITTPTISASNATICQTAVAALTVVGANSYTWYPNISFGNILTDNPNSTTIYTVEGNSFGCYALTTASVLVHPLPLPVISAPQSICSGHSLTLSGGGGVSYHWTGPAAFSSTLQSPIIFNMSASQAGIYSLTVTSINNCNATTQTSITTMPSPTPAVSGSSVCIGESATLHGSGGASYQWSGPNNFSVFQQDVFIPIVNQNSMGIYTVTVIGTNLCFATATLNLLGYPYPLPTPVISGNTKVCQNSQFHLIGTGGTVYYWQGPNNFSSTSQSINIVANNITTGGIYTLSVKNTSNCAASKTVQLNVLLLPNAYLKVSNNNLCVPFCTNFSLQEQNNLTPVVNTNFQVDAVNTNSIYCIKQAGGHYVTATFKDANNCSNSSALILIGYPKPEADFYFTPKVPTEGFDLVQFRDTSRGEEIIKWNWFFKDSTQNSTTSSLQNPSYFYENSGSYPVALVIENKWNCIDTLVKTVVIAGDFAFYLPNTFTPNDDNLNDIFQPKGFGIKKYQLHIYDRWGHILFGTTDFFKGWDGKFNGEECPNDTYVWKAAVSTSTGIEKSFVGNVRLMR